MKLSIVVPIFNVENYLRRCLNSFQSNQNKNVFEVIMVDDGSTDKSGLIADEFANLYRNYHSFHKENGGLSDARNFGLKKASGEYIWFVDSDDYITDGAIDEFYHISESVSADVYCFNVFKENEENISKYPSYKEFSELKSGRDFLMYQYKNKSFRPEAWRNIYKKVFLLNNQCFFLKGIVHEDEEWTPRTLIKAEKIYYSGFYSYVYFVRKNSIMKQQIFNKHIESIKFTIDEYDYHDFGFDSNLKKFALDRMINNYVSCFSKGQFYNEERYFLPYSFFKGKMVFLRTKFKVFLFVINKKLFCKLSKIISSNR